MAARDLRTRLRLTRKHAWTFAALFAAFSGLTYWATNVLLDAGPHHTKYVILTTAATLLGPFTGAISRRSQSCCLAFSWSLLPYAAGALAVCMAMQLVPLPSGRWWERLRLFAWSVGWLAWFASGIISLGHALE